MMKNIFEADQDRAVRECVLSMAAQYRRFNARPMSITEVMTIIQTTCARIILNGLSR